ncbi:Putative flippase GtrA (transmembrane translocase of bactoprenol-linked glucose) [Sanguibacter gelidistatuariae]|uniref:Putative flippase GtrA (Transmembrane translocase of bactoprenol-linked glucose) n=2 Tax=Sanguibacter gelidistatuariae TaxID=1814289 RepID=A0A1G6QMB9_9MICO|nr:Putative flippase GtrA (transmembrane translocase of bactoprenol-linked glucose) [Sanguibacter gelidistatuariae]
MTSVGLTGADVTGAEAVAAADPDARAPGRRAALLARLYELMRFGMVGGVAFVVDTGLFNLLRFGPGDLLEAKPITAKIISVAVATVVSWLGNRFWTFSDRRTETHLREFAGFVVVNIGGMAIAIASLGVSHYVLDLRSPLADNISANGVGLVLGMVFRYYAYRTWVFTAKDPSRPLTAASNS